MAEETQVTLVCAVQTSLACPSQWNAWDAEGNYYYLRYRHGYGQVRQYQSEQWYEADEDQWIADIASFEFGDSLDGSIGLEHFAELAGIKLDPNMVMTDYVSYLRNAMLARGHEPGVIDKVMPMDEL